MTIRLGKFKASEDSLWGEQREFHFTADEGDLHSQNTILNERQLYLRDVQDRGLEQFWALSKLQFGEPGDVRVELAPLSYAFIALTDAKLVVCAEVGADRK